jgi:hypothetical protein
MFAKSERSWLVSFAKLEDGDFQNLIYANEVQREPRKIQAINSRRY